MPRSWVTTPLAEVVRLKRGYDLPTQDRVPGNVPILGSFGITGQHNVAKVGGPGVTIGRSGASIGVATFTAQDYWPLNTALYVEDFKGNEPLWVYWMLHSIDFTAYNSGSAQPSLNRNYVSNIPVLVPPLAAQRSIAAALGALDDLIEANQRIAGSSESLAIALTEATSDRVVLSELATDLKGRVAAPAGLTDHYSLPAFDVDRLPERLDGGEIKSNKTQLDDPVVLVSRLNPHIPRVWMVYPSQGVLSAASTEFVPVTGAGASVEEVWAVCSGSAYLGQLNGLVTGTTGSHQRVEKDALLTLVVPDVRSLAASERRAIVTLVQEAHSSRSAARNLIRTRDELLPHLLAGRVSFRESAA